MIANRMATGSGKAYLLFLGLPQMTPSEKTNKYAVFWCQRGDSNPHDGFTRLRILSPLCLPFHHSGLDRDAPSGR